MLSGPMPWSLPSEVSYLPTICTSSGLPVEERMVMLPLGTYTRAAVPPPLAYAVLPWSYVPGMRITVSPDLRLLLSIASWIVPNAAAADVPLPELP